jgi:hypothetical protein
MAIVTVGIDLAKAVFAVHGVGVSGKPELVRPEVRRVKLLELIASLPPYLIGMEACSGAHHWAREFQKLGHTVRIMAPKFVSPYRMSGNVLLDEVDKVLEARGYSFARYADDCNVYVSSKKAGERVMVLLRKLYAGLKLQINEAKSAVGSAFGRKFLGYSLWVAKGKEVKCKVAEKPLQNFKAKVRQLTRRTGGRSMEQVVERLRPYLLGWKAYFGLAQTPRVWASWTSGYATD